MSDKKRVDVALVERGLAASREKAQALIMPPWAKLLKRRMLNTMAKPTAISA